MPTDTDFLDYVYAGGHRMGLNVNAKRAVKAVVSPLVRDRVYVIRRGLARGLRRRGGFDFAPELLRPLTAEERFLLSLRLDGATVFDVGGFEGVFALFLARAVGARGKVVVFEPNPMNARAIIDNVALNGFRNVVVQSVALGRRSGETTLKFRDDARGTGFVSDVDGADRASTQGLLQVRVRVETLDDVVQRFGHRPNFVKIDVEGAECDVLEGAADTLSRLKPTLFIEVHGFNRTLKVENARRVLTLVEAADYASLHIESGLEVTSSDAQRAMEGHLYCV